jgi:hypothetical protein
MSILDLFKKRPTEPTIRVQYVDAAGNSVLGYCNMPVSRLPESFALQTTVSIQDHQWSVVSAEPTEKADFLKTGQLRLVLSRLTSVDPKDILFSLPTISNDVGRTVGDAVPNDNVFVIHEDDWRQVEFVSSQFSSKINEEIADIRRIWESQRSGPAFKTLHVRDRIPEPLAGCSLALGDLKEIIRPQRAFDAVGFIRTAGTVPQSFAWALDEKLILWGVAGTDGRIHRLCLRGFARRERVSETSSLLAAFTDRYRLYFVDWCRMAVISDNTAFQMYLGQTEAQ